MLFGQTKPPQLSLLAAVSVFVGFHVFILRQLAYFHTPEIFIKVSLLTVRTLQHEHVQPQTLRQKLLFTSAHRPSFLYNLHLFLLQTF